MHEMTAVTFISLQHICFLKGSALSTTVIIVENGVLDTSTNPGRVCVSLRVNFLKIGMNPSPIPQLWIDNVDLILASVSLVDWKFYDQSDSIRFKFDLVTWVLLKVESGSETADLKMEYIFIVITPDLFLTEVVFLFRVPYIGQIDLFVRKSSKRIG